MHNDKKLLGENITEPPGLPDNILRYRLVDVFTAASDNDMREEVLGEFCKTNPNLQPLIAGRIGPRNRISWKK